MGTRITTISDLSESHDYYCHDNNFYSNKPREEFESWPDFMASYRDADVDMNLVFRWDINDGCMNIFMMQQRKGIFKPIIINRVTDEDVQSIQEYLNKHWEKLVRIWRPISE